MQLPKLRSELDIYPIEYEKKIYFCVKDLEGYTEDILLITPETAIISSFFDGKNTSEEIKTFFSKNFPDKIITDSDIEQVIKILDEKLLLDTENFQSKKNYITQSFIKQPYRVPFLAGKSYSAVSEELKKEITNYFTVENGPGPIQKEEMLIKSIKGFISPHIDFFRGGYCYAYAYKELAESIKPSKAIILGVAHSSPPYPYTLLDKNYHTPLGTVEFDKEFLNYISGDLYNKLIQYQFAHKIEHSIEFQSVWLKYVMNTDNIKIVPVLCSIIPKDEHKQDSEEFIQACKKYIADSNNDCIVIAGADLSHIGPRFGDNVEINEKILEWMTKDDLASLKHCEKIEAENFLKYILPNNDIKKVCGLSCIYTALQILTNYATSGKILKYGFAHDPSGGAVSFASVVFT